MGKLDKNFKIISLILLLLCVVVSRLIIIEYHKQEDIYLKGDLDSFSSKFSSTIGVYEVFSNYIYEEIINKPQVLSIMRNALHSNESERDILRRELYDLLYDDYTAIKKYHFRQLHFHFLNGDSFLRMHSPKKFGDNLFGVRESLRVANTEKIYVTGFEEGRIFNGYRFIYPLFYENEHLGTVEVSISIGTLVDVLPDLYPNLDVFFIMKKDVVDAKVFGEMRENYETTFFSKNYYFDKSVHKISLKKAAENKVLEKINREMFKDEIEEKIDVGESFSVLKKKEKNYYLINFLSIKNIKGEHVAYLVSLSEDYYFENVYNKYLVILGLVVLITLISILTVNIYIKSQEKFKLLSNTDYLTKVYNRLKFLEIANTELKRSKRHNTAFSILMLDIDHFKNVNDTYGHNIGDEVLKEISRLVSNRVRETDVFARWGGEEFICLLSETSVGNALVVAESIRKIIEYHHFHKVGHLTISIGIADNKNSHNIDEIIEKADMALYESKNNGRNMITSFSKNKV